MRALRCSAAPSIWATWVTESLAVAPVCGPRLFEHLKTKRLTKRVVQKPDGRYLIYYAPRATK
ncbi:MAG TPA: hypothetical protein VIJ91_09205 [Candidatus Dormibacteraeota bacterium]|jgi:hypothetical protein